jgi:hypothetical protein
MLVMFMGHVERGTTKPAAAAFDEAATFIEMLAIKAGNSVSPDHLARALKIIEELRAATITNTGPR